MLDTLPMEIRESLAELELELSEGKSSHWGHYNTQHAIAQLLTAKHAGICSTTPEILHIQCMGFTVAIFHMFSSMTDCRPFIHI